METDVSGLLAEALTANVQAILANKATLVTADTAVSLLAHILWYSGQYTIVQNWSKTKANTTIKYQRHR